MFLVQTNDAKDGRQIYWWPCVSIWISIGLRASQGNAVGTTTLKPHRMTRIVLFHAFILLSLISTARLCASKPSHFANSMTASPTFFSPSCVRFELVMCFVKLLKFTPEYCR